MTNFTTKLMIAAATSLVAAGTVTTASAQSMKAEIPFTFRVSNKVMSAGSYRVEETRGALGYGPFHIASADGSSHAVVLPAGGKDPDKKWVDNGKAVLAFDCSSGTCRLAALYNPVHGPEYTFPGAKLGKGERAGLVLIDLKTDKGD